MYIHIYTYVYVYICVYVCMYKNIEILAQQKNSKTHSTGSMATNAMETPIGK